MAVKRLFEEEAIPARIIGASSVEAAMNQLKKNSRYRAVLVQWEEAGQLALELACAVKERGRPAIVAFQKEWDKDDIRRALQLGVDSLLYDPFTIDELFADLKAITEEGVSRTRAQILSQGSEALLEPDANLWVQQDDDWRARMMSLADQMQRPWSENVAKKAGDLENTLRRIDEEGEIDPLMAKAVMAVLDQGRDRLPELAKEHKVEARSLARVTSAVEDFAEHHGGPSRIPLLMNEVIRKVDDGGGQTGGKLLILKRVARVVLRTQGHSGRKKDALNETMRKMIGVPMPVLVGLTPDDRVDLSGRLLFAETEEEALDHCRLMVFSHMLRNVDRFPTSPNHLHALAAILGLKARISGITPEELLQRLAVLNPSPVLYDVDLLDLEPFRELIPDPPTSALDKALAGALDGLLEAGDPLGDLDQRRLSALLGAVRTESAVLIGRPTWRTLHIALSSEVRPPVDRIIDRMTFLLGARTHVARNRLLQALADLIDVGRHALDAARFAEFCRAAAYEPLSREVIEEYAAETPAEFTPDRDRRPGAAEEQALVTAALDALKSAGIDPQAVLENLPPAPRIATRLNPEEMTRMRVLAAGLEGKPMGEQEKLVTRSLGGEMFKMPQLAAMESMLGEGATVEMLRTHTAPEEEEDDTPLVEHFERGLTGPMMRIDPDAHRRSAQVLAERQAQRWAASGGEEADELPRRERRRQRAMHPDDIDLPVRDETMPRIPGYGGTLSDSVEGELSAPTLEPLQAVVPEPPPGSTPVDMGRLQKYIDMGDLDAAAQLVRETEDGTLRLPDGLNMVALHMYVAGRRTAAGALWERAVRLGPDQINILFNLARLRCEMGQAAEARPLLRRVLRVRPHLTPARRLFMQVRAEMRAEVG